MEGRREKGKRERKEGERNGRKEGRREGEGRLRVVAMLY
jgi:hypothetical protein